MKKEVSQQDKVLQEIKTLCLASIPIIVIRTFEESQLLGRLNKMALENGREDTWVWKCTTGLLKFPYTSEKRDDSTLDIRQCLVSLLERCKTPQDYEKKEFFILVDAHPYIDNPSIIRHLKDISSIWGKSKKTLILVSPVLKIPEELSKDVFVVDYPLPDRFTINDRIIPFFIADIKRQYSDKVKVSDTKEDILALGDAVSGLTEQEILRNSKVLIIEKRSYTGEEASHLLEQKRQIVKKSGLLEFLDSGDTEVGGLKNLVTWLKQRGKLFTPEAREAGIPFPKGVFLMGVPGTGKTLVAKMCGKLWGKPVLRWDISKMFGSLQGQTESNVNMAIQVAESVSPCILMIDEVEKALSGTGSSNMTDGGTSDRVMGRILTWAQEKTSPVFLICTANSLKSLPPEFTRKGRFDELFFVGLPDKTERLDIFNIHLKKKNIKLTEEDKIVAVEMTKDYTGAEIEAIVIDAMILAFDKNRKIEIKDIIEAISSTKPLSETQKEVIQEGITWANERARLANNWKKEIKEVVETSNVEGLELG